MNWKETLAGVAPTIAAAIGGPFAGMAVKVASNALGIEADEKALQDAILSGDPQALLAVKNADNAFQLELERLGVEKDKIAAADRNSARDLAKSKGMLPQILLSVAYSIAYGVVMWAFMSGQINVPEEQQILFGALIGILTGAQTQILNFWFGSSSGSKEKNKNVQ